MEMKEEALGAADGERRDHHCSPTPNSLADNLVECIFRIARVVAAVAIGRLDDQVVGPLDRHRVDHDRIVVATQVAREDDARPGPVELHGRSSQNVPGPPQTGGGPT